VKTTFHTIADIDYPVVDADAHVNEPPETWQDRVPAKWRDRAPKVLHRDDGDWWSFDDGARLRPVGLTATAGLSYVQYRPSGIRYSEMRPGSFEPKARLADMDADGIDAQVLYPSVGLHGAKLYAEEPELQLACVRAYNEWLAEFCEAGDGRLVGQAIIPTTGIRDAVQEAQKAIDLGMRGVIISRFPNGDFDPDPVDERFWGFVSDAQLPVAVHIGSFMRENPDATWPDTSQLSFVGLVAASHAGAHTLPVACAIVFSGALERFPELNIVLVESNIGWIPTTLEHMDDVFLRYRWFTGAVENMQRMPSELFHRNMWATFIVDTVGLELRHRLNLNHVMWSTDYPHTVSEWPNSRVVIERQFRGLPLDEVQRMLSTNCRTLYRIEFDGDRWA
jgi:uncharacterized protein